MTASQQPMRVVRPASRAKSIVPAYQAAWFAGHDRIIAPIRRHLTAFPEHGQCLVDIGAGDGSVLDDIASRLPQFKELIGITVDRRGLSLAEVRVHHDARLRFHCGNPWVWLRRPECGRAVAFSYDNLSVVPESLLMDWFAELANLGIAALALVEARDGGCAQLPELLWRCGWKVQYAENAYQDERAWWHVFASLDKADVSLRSLT